MLDDGKSFDWLDETESPDGIQHCFDEVAGEVVKVGPKSKSIH